MNHLLDVTNYTQPIDGFVDKLAFGGQMVLIGMSVVFSVLILLWLSLYIFKVFFHDIPAKKKSVSLPEATTEPQEVKTSTAKQNNDEEIISVIAAAIAAAESENQGLKFRVVSFRRK